MVFSSTLFLFIYLPVVLLVYYIAPLKWRNVILFVCSLLFYGWGEPVYVFLMIFMIALDYVFGMLIEKNQLHSESDLCRRRAKGWLITSILLNLGVLFLFKYLDFVIQNLSQIPIFSGLHPLGLVMPIGISFYTFQKMSYCIDVYRRDSHAQKDYIRFGAYVTMFPQLIAGPIVKYKDVEEQLSDREHTTDRFADGVTIFVIGLAKKVLLANSIGVLWDTYKAAGFEALSVGGAWLAAIAFSFQIYFDFSGYSDMAVGLGRMFGFEFMKNFNYPYIADSITDFWRRWHISLSTWFKEYLYIPLGGNRKGKWRNVLNLLIVWTVTGIWHGAAWNFLLWGLYYAVLLIIEKLWLLKWMEHWPKWCRHLYTLLIVVAGWAIFACDSLKECLVLLGKMFGIGAAAVWMGIDFYYLRSYGLTLFILTAASVPLGGCLYHRLGNQVRSILTPILLLIGLLLVTAVVVDSTYNPFLYFRF